MQITVVFDKFYSASRLFLIFLHRMTVRKADSCCRSLKGNPVRIRNNTRCCKSLRTLAAFRIRPSPYGMPDWILHADNPCIMSLPQGGKAHGRDKSEDLPPCMKGVAGLRLSFALTGSSWGFSVVFYHDCQGTVLALRPVQKFSCVHSNNHLIHYYHETFLSFRTGTPPVPRFLHERAESRN